MLVQRLRKRLVTVSKPGAKAFKPTYPISYTYTAGTVHKPGDSAGYVSFNPSAGACAAGYDPTHVLAIEHVFAVDPLCEEAAAEIERLRALLARVRTHVALRCACISEVGTLAQDIDSALASAPETGVACPTCGSHLPAYEVKVGDSLKGAGGPCWIDDEYGNIHKIYPL